MLATDRTISEPTEVARVSIPTPAGEFDVHAFESSSGFVYLAMVRGEIGDGLSVLVRLHSECLTGDALGSLRCDCGPQLRMGLRAIAAEGRGVLVYATGQEGRGVGLINKLRAYVLQERGVDTLDANRRLGLPVDGRDYEEAAACLRALGIRSVRLLTNNPQKEIGLREGDVDVEQVIPIPTSPHLRNVRYLRTKRERLGHHEPTGSDPGPSPSPVVDVASLLGDVRPLPWRPYVVVKYAQTLDGRIATATGDSRWISGEEERRLSHALRAACDAVLVGVGTVVHDDPQLTVRMVPGHSPIRVILDTRLRVPMDAHVFDDGAGVIVLTTDRAPRKKVDALKERGIAVRDVARTSRGVDVRAALRTLKEMGIDSLLVEGGARVITSMLAEDVADRLIVGLAPTVIGAGTEAVGDLGVSSVAEGLRLADRTVHVVGDDLLVAGDVVPHVLAPPGAGPSGD